MIQTTRMTATTSISDSFDEPHLVLTKINVISEAYKSE